MAAGLLEAFGNWGGVTIQVGRASQAGIFAAMLVQKGAQGSHTILEGGGFGTASGYLEAYAEKYNLDLLTKGLGQDYMVMDVASEINGGCRHQHATADAIIELINRHNLQSLEIDDIKEIKVGTYDESYRLCAADGNLDRGSLAYSVSIPFLAGDAFPDKYSDEQAASEPMQRLMAKVKVAVDPEIEGEFPSKWASRVEVTTKDGDSYRLKIDGPKGERSNPLTKQEKEDKFRRQVGPYLGFEKTEQAIGVISNLEAMKDLSDLASLLKL
jgi:2-methylcitrate dehydratase PrpD